jgi:Holliday junction DNA helicase RuvA
MIASLRGTLGELGAGHVVVECAGVGYLVLVSTHTLAKLPARGDEVHLRTRQIVREDSVQLFGFGDAGELRLFDLLIGVSGVGPKLALSLLSGMPVAAVARAIHGGQVAALTSIPGIGKKTAERVIVELRDKVDPSLAAVGAAARVPEPAATSPHFEDAVAALTALGYTPSVAKDTLRRLGTEAEGLGLETLVRRALGLLSRPAVTGRT